MNYSLLVLASPLSGGTANRSACRFAEAVISRGHALRRVFFYDRGAETALATAVTPPDSEDLRSAWLSLAEENATELVSCVASGLRQGVLDDGEAARHARPRTQLKGFTTGGLGLLVDAIAGSDRVVTFGESMDP